jgi:hypothetical protein
MAKTIKQIATNSDGLRFYIRLNSRAQVKAWCTAFNIAFNDNITAPKLRNAVEADKKITFEVVKSVAVAVAVADNSDKKAIAWQELKVVLDSRDKKTLEFGKVKNSIVKNNSDNDTINYLIAELTKYLPIEVPKPQKYSDL